MLLFVLGHLTCLNSHWNSEIKIWKFISQDMVFINVFVFYGNQVFRKIIFVVCWKNKFKFQQKVTKKLQIFSPLFVKKIFPIALSIDILSCWSKLLHLFWHLSGRFFCCLQNNFLSFWRNSAIWFTYFI